MSNTAKCGSYVEHPTGALSVMALGNFFWLLSCIWSIRADKAWTIAWRKFLIYKNTFFMAELLNPGFLLGSRLFQAITCTCRIINTTSACVIYSVCSIDEHRHSNARVMVIISIWVSYKSKCMFTSYEMKHSTIISMCICIYVILYMCHIANMEGESCLWWIQFRQSTQNINTSMK